MTTAMVRLWPQLWFSQLVTWHPQPILNSYRWSGARPFLSPSNQQHCFARGEPPSLGPCYQEVDHGEPRADRNLRVGRVVYHIWYGYMGDIWFLGGNLSTITIIWLNSPFAGMLLRWFQPDDPTANLQLVFFCQFNLRWANCFLLMIMN